MEKRHSPQATPFPENIAQNKIDMRAFSLAETSDFGIARVIVDDVYKTTTVLKDAGGGVVLHTEDHVGVVHIPPPQKGVHILHVHLGVGEFPMLEKPTLDYPTLENPTQLNKDINN